MAGPKTDPNCLPSLLLVDNPSQRRQFARALFSEGYLRARSWKEFLLLLNQQISTFVVLSSKCPIELCDALRQFSAQTGLVSIKDPINQQIWEARFDPRHVKLAILVDRELLPIVSE